MLASGLCFPLPTSLLSSQVHDQALAGAARAPLGRHLHPRQRHQHPDLRDDAAPLDLLVAAGGRSGSRTCFFLGGESLDFTPSVDLFSQNPSPTGKIFVLVWSWAQGGASSNRTTFVGTFWEGGDGPAPPQEGFKAANGSLWC